MSEADYTILGEIDAVLLGGEFGELKTSIVIVTNANQYVIIVL